jgi:hypothetical protein
MPDEIIGFLFLQIADLTFQGHPVTFHFREYRGH